MYCSHCGTENENTAKFCRQCGNALQANAQSNSAPSAFEQEISASKGRQSVANFLRAFQAHVAPQAKNYSVLNAQCSQMEMLERQRADFEKRVKSPVLLILGIVLIALGIGLIASFVSYMQAHIDEAVIIENPTLADYLDTFRPRCCSSQVPLSSAASSLRSSSSVRRVRRKLARNSTANTLRPKSAAQTAANEIWHNYESFANHQLVAFKYANPWLLDALARIVADGKANTLTQAIQYFENESYQQEMKGIANANLYATQETLERTKSIQRQLAYIGVTSTIGAIGAWRN